MKNNKKHFTRTEDFTTEEFLEIIRRAKIFDKGIKNGKNFTHLCPGKILATMFFQESTRTSASLKASIVRLGGGWFGIDGIKGTYLETGEEDMEDTLNGLASVCDIMAIRDKSFNLTQFARKGFRVPLMNAMCGNEEHTLSAPTLLYLAKEKFGNIKNLKIGIYGMTKSSRPTKAAVKVFSRFGVKFYEDSVVPEFKLPKYIRKIIKDNNSVYMESKLNDFIDKVDYLFIVEGLPQSGENPELIKKFNKAFVPFSKNHLKKIKKTAIVNAFEPRTTTDGRLTALKETDNDPRMQTKLLIEKFNYTTMAIITYLLNIDVE